MRRVGQATEYRIQESEEKAEARNQEPEEKRAESVEAVLSLIFWLLTPDF
jgi:hypothetical protein